MHVMTVAPALDPVALYNVPMKAKKYGGWIAASRGPMQYAKVTVMMKPVVPLSTMAQIIAHGSTRDASRISSALRSLLASGRCGILV